MHKPESGEDLYAYYRIYAKLLCKWGKVAVQLKHEKSFGCQTWELEKREDGQLYPTSIGIWGELRFVFAGTEEFHELPKLGGMPQKVDIRRDTLVRWLEKAIERIGDLIADESSDNDVPWGLGSPRLPETWKELQQILRTLRDLCPEGIVEIIEQSNLPERLPKRRPKKKAADSAEPDWICPPRTFLVLDDSRVLLIWQGGEKALPIKSNSHLRYLLDLFAIEEFVSSEKITSEINERSGKTRNSKPSKWVRELNRNHAWKIKQYLPDFPDDLIAFKLNKYSSRLPVKLADDVKSDNPT